MNDRTRASEATMLIERLVALVGRERVLDRPIERIAYASDASFYRRIPQAVVRPGTIADVQALFSLSHALGVPLTFRAAGTSLSGQTVTDGILVEAVRDWRRVRVEDGGKTVRVQPGVIGARVNAALRPFGVRIGPDPASIGTAMIGGILANNSSGMCCGVTENAYHTLESLTFLLASGTVVDTAAPSADAIFHEAEPALAQGLLQLKAEIDAAPALRDRIRAKYRTKNTTGYSINAFVDYDTAVQIFAHLLIGSEGTLAFIAEAVLATVPDLPVKYTGLLLFADLYAACEAIVPLRDAGARAVELMDRASLRAVEDQPGIPAAIKRLGPAAAGLLVEFQAADEDRRANLAATAGELERRLTLVEPARFTHDPVEQAQLWRIRQGMFPSVGAVRARGTTVIIEDVAFPVERLADAALDLNALFRKHGYDNGIVFGHAKDGNLHFVITQSFNDAAAVAQYARFMDDLVHLVVDGYAGALKAEHGTGRNVAPFVEAEWGAEAYSIMTRVKALADPTGLLNPGVIINADPLAHLADLKRMPVVEEEIDSCIECGFCEPKCPSRDVTLTPRQRIAVRREIARLTARGTPEAIAGLENDFAYMGVDTCAVDGLCATACPVGIDTGRLTKRLRRLRRSPAANARARWLADHFGLVERAVRIGLRGGSVVRSLFGDAVMSRATRAIRKVGLGVPAWSADVPRAARRLPRTTRHDAQAVYFPSCVSRVLGALPGEPAEPSVMAAFVALADRAGSPVTIPGDVAGTCCGVAFASKGYDDAHRFAANRAIERLWRWSDAGRLPVVIDTTPCTYALSTCRGQLSAENQRRFDGLHIMDAITFVHDQLLSRLIIARGRESVVVHPVCSVTKLGLGRQLETVVQAASRRVTVPTTAGCCGFAGDRGFLFPELTETATREEAVEVRAGDHDGYVASSRTCEIGLTRATSRLYRSYIHLLEEASRV